MTEMKRCTKCQGIKSAINENFRWCKESNRYHSWCRQCERDHNKHYRQINLDKERQRNQHYYQTNTNKVRERQKYYKRVDSDKDRARIRRWQKANPVKVREIKQRRRARQHFLPATFTEQDWIKALEYFHGCCAYCGNPPSLFDRITVLHREHHIPLSKGGGYTPDNILPACQSCNFSKCNKGPYQWIMKRFGKRQGQIVINRIRDYFNWVQQHAASTT